MEWLCSTKPSWWNFHSCHAFPVHDVLSLALIHKLIVRFCNSQRKQSIIICKANEIQRNVFASRNGSTNDRYIQKIKPEINNHRSTTCQNSLLTKLSCSDYRSKASGLSIFRRKNFASYISVIITAIPRSKWREKVKSIPISGNCLFNPIFQVP